MKIRLTPGRLLLLSIPLLGVILGLVSWWAHRATSYRLLRKPPPAEPARKVLDPGTAVGRLRGAADPGASGSPDLQKAKEDLVALEAAAVPLIRQRLYDPSEAPFLKLHLVDVLSEMKAPEARKELLSLFGDPSQEERLRTLAVVKLSARPRDEDFPLLRKVYLEEPGYAGRHLLIRAIGRSGDLEGTAILLEAAEKDPNPSVRIQALESLGGRIGEAGVLEVVRRVARSGDSENVRLAALSAMGRSREASVEQTFREIAGDPQAPERLREAARKKLEERPRP